MADELDGRTVVFLVASEGVDRAELTQPWAAVRDAGGRPVLVSETPGSVEDLTVDQIVGETHPHKYDGLVVPGGAANVDELRAVPNAVRLVGEFMARGKPVAAVGYAPSLLAAADVLRGRRVTSDPAVDAVLRDAGADRVDEPTVTDAGLVTGRGADDLAAFCDAAVAAIAAGDRTDQATSA